MSLVIFFVFFVFIGKQLFYEILFYYKSVYWNIITLIGIEKIKLKSYTLFKTNQEEKSNNNYGFIFQSVKQ